MKYIGNRPHPKMQQEFLTYPATKTKQKLADKLISRKGLKEAKDDKVG